MEIETIKDKVRVYNFAASFAILLFPKIRNVLLGYQKQIVLQTDGQLISNLRNDIQEIINQGTKDFNTPNDPLQIQYVYLTHDLLLRVEAKEKNKCDVDIVIRCGVIKFERLQEVSHDHFLRCNYSVEEAVNYKNTIELLTNLITCLEKTIPCQIRINK